jgi:hypothetical protein
MNKNWTIPAHPGFFVVTQIHDTPLDWPPLTHVDTTPIIAWTMDDSDLLPVTSDLECPMPVDGYVHRIAILRPDGRVDFRGAAHASLEDYAKDLVESLKRESRKD